MGIVDDMCEGAMKNGHELRSLPPGDLGAGFRSGRLFTRKAVRLQPLLLAGLSGMLLTLPLVVPSVSVAASPEGGVKQSQSGPIRASSRASETLYLNNDRPYDYNLNVDSTVTFNGLTIPAGSTIRGQYQPAEGGLRYVANSVEIGDRIYSLNATSEVIADMKDPRETSTGAILGDAAIGAAGGAAVGGIFGSVDVLEVLGGAAAGVVVGNVTAVPVVVIEPQQSILLY